jgi:two-component system OmpR family response regulator
MRVLIVEDELNLRRHLQFSLECASYTVDCAEPSEAEQFLRWSGQYDAVIADLGLCDLHWLTVIDRCRENGRKFPLLVIADRNTWADKVARVDAGADDYLPKPFHMDELIKRLGALIARAPGRAGAELAARDILLNACSRKVTKKGKPLKLTTQEYRLLSLLMRHKGKVFSGAELIECVRDEDVNTNSIAIEVCVSRLRKKVGMDLITTTDGLGYSIDDEAQGRAP